MPPASGQNQMKVQGLAFGRTLLRAFKVALLYSVEHSASQNILQQAYDSLNLLLKQSNPFTFGFLNQRVRLNNILTSDSALSSLEADFSRRGLAAITFAAGITFSEFKRLLALLTAKPEIIEQNGGIKALLERNPVEGVRLLPGKKGGGPAEDTVLEMDSESYLMAQAILGPGSATAGPGLPSLELLLQSAGMEKPAGFAGNAGELLGLAEKATQAALADPQRNPGAIAEALARVLEELTPDLLLSALPGGKQADLRGRAPGEVAAELVEDIAAKWAVERVSGSAGQPGGVGQEEEISQILARAIQTTKTAERLLQKFARLMEEANLPPEISERTHQELKWIMLSPQEKHDQLISLKQFSPPDFRHLLSYIAEMRNEGSAAEAIEVAGHYFGLLGSTPPAARAEELRRVPELLRAINDPQTWEFMQELIERLRKELLDVSDMECHRAVAQCLTSAANEVAIYEDFACVRQIGMDLGRSLARDKTQHADCCAEALRSLLTPRSIERLLELYVQKSSEAGWPKLVASLLKWAGPQGAEISFQRLEEETATPNRLRLIRLLAHLGTDAIAPTRKRLGDERWYVVRNACYILGALGDPRLSRHLAEALCHPDARVQQAALTSIITAHPPDRGEMLAAALPSLHSHLQDVALDELMLLRNPSLIQGLEEFLHRGQEIKTSTLLKVVQVLSALRAENAVEALGRMLSDTSQASAVRRAALVSLSLSPFPRAQHLLAEFARLNPADPLAAECQQS